MPRRTTPLLSQALSQYERSRKLHLAPSTLLNDHSVLSRFVRGVSDRQTHTLEAWRVENYFLAESERALILERQAEGISAAKARGVYKGRRPSLTSSQAMELARRATAGESMSALAREFGISRQTAYSYRRLATSPSGLR